MRARRRQTRAAGPLQAIGCGVDVVELPRLRRVIARSGDAFLRRVFTRRERAYATARPRTTLLHLAGRFAAKEAVIKAMSQVEAGRKLSMREVEVLNDRLGRPYVVLHDRRPKRAARWRVAVSLSHVNSVAVASAIVTR